MSTYNYNQQDLLDLYEEAKTIGNLSANIGLSTTTLRRLLNNPEMWPNKNTVNKIKPFALGYRKIEQIRRPYNTGS